MSIFQKSGKKAKARAFQGEIGGGGEIVEIIIGLGVAVGLGAILFIFQGTISDAINQMGTKITGMLNKMSSGITPGA